MGNQNSTESSPRSPESKESKQGLSGEEIDDVLDSLKNRLGDKNELENLNEPILVGALKSKIINCRGADNVNQDTVQQITSDVEDIIESVKKGGIELDFTKEQKKNNDTEKSEKVDNFNKGNLLHFLLDKLEENDFRPAKSSMKDAGFLGKISEKFGVSKKEAWNKIKKLKDSLQKEGIIYIDKKDNRKEKFDKEKIREKLDIETTNDSDKTNNNKEAKENIETAKEVFLKNAPNFSIESINYLEKGSPEKINREKLEKAEKVVMGDSHASALKILETAVAADLATIPKEDAKKFIKLYKEAVKTCNASTDTIGSKEFEEKKRELLNLIDKIEWVGGDRKLMLIGDVISDRGLSDDLVIGVVNKLKEEGDVDILAGNHDLDYIFSKVAESESFNASYMGDEEQKISYYRTINSIGENKGEKMTEDFLKSMKLVDYDIENNTLFSHAEIDSSMIEAFIDASGLDEVKTKKDVQDLVRNINEWFKDQINNVIEEGEDYHIGNLEFLSDFVWARKSRDNEPKYNKDSAPLYNVVGNFVHGHHNSDSEFNTSYKKRSEDYQHNNNGYNIVNLNDSSRKAGYYPRSELSKNKSSRVFILDKITSENSKEENSTEIEESASKEKNKSKITEAEFKFAVDNTKEAFQEIKRFLSDDNFFIETDGGKFIYKRFLEEGSSKELVSELINVDILQEATDEENKNIKRGGSGLYLKINEDIKNYKNLEEFNSRKKTEKYESEKENKKGKKNKPINQIIETLNEKQTIQSFLHTLEEIDDKLHEHESGIIDLKDKDKRKLVELFELITGGQKWNKDFDFSTFKKELLEGGKEKKEQGVEVNNKEIQKLTSDIVSKLEDADISDDLIDSVSNTETSLVLFLAKDNPNNVEKVISDLFQSFYEGAKKDQNNSLKASLFVKEKLFAIKDRLENISELKENKKQVEEAKQDLESARKRFAELHSELQELNKGIGNMFKNLLDGDRRDRISQLEDELIPKVRNDFIEAREKIIEHAAELKLDETKKFLNETIDGEEGENKFSKSLDFVHDKWAKVDLKNKIGISLGLAGTAAVSGPIISAVAGTGYTTYKIVAGISGGVGAKEAMEASRDKKLMDDANKLIENFEEDSSQVSMEELVDLYVDLSGKAVQKEEKIADSEYRLYKQFEAIENAIESKWESQRENREKIEAINDRLLNIDKEIQKKADKDEVISRWQKVAGTTFGVIIATGTTGKAIGNVIEGGKDLYEHVSSWLYGTEDVVNENINEPKLNRSEIEQDSTKEIQSESGLENTVKENQPTYEVISETKVGGGGSAIGSLQEIWGNNHSKLESEFSSWQDFRDEILKNDYGYEIEDGQFKHTLNLHEGAQVKLVETDSGYTVRFLDDPSTDINEVEKLDNFHTFENDAGQTGEVSMAKFAENNPISDNSLTTEHGQVGFEYSDKGVSIEGARGADQFNHPEQIFEGEEINPEEYAKIKENMQDAVVMDEAYNDLVDQGLGNSQEAQALKQEVSIKLNEIVAETDWTVKDEWFDKYMGTLMEEGAVAGDQPQGFVDTGEAIDWDNMDTATNETEFSQEFGSEPSAGVEDNLLSAEDLESAKESIKQELVERVKTDNEEAEEVVNILKETIDNTENREGVYSKFFENGSVKDKLGFLQEKISSSDNLSSQGREHLNSLVNVEFGDKTFDIATNPGETKGSAIAIKDSLDNTHLFVGSDAEEFGPHPSDPDTPVAIISSEDGSMSVLKEVEVSKDGVKIGEVISRENM